MGCSLLRVANIQKDCNRLRNPTRKLKYELSIFRLNAADFGVPQHRDRVFIIGHSAGLKIPRIPPICGPSDFLNGLGLFPQRTVAQALKGLPQMETRDYAIMLVETTA